VQAGEVHHASRELQSLWTTMQKILHCHLKLQSQELNDQPHHILLWIFYDGLTMTATSLVSFAMMSQPFTCLVW